MAEVTEHYDDLAERQEKIDLREGQGLVMYHDDFDPDWQPGDEPHGTLTFDDPIPKTPEQLYQEQLAAEMNEKHEELLAALKHWQQVTPAQKDQLLKDLLKWVLWKDGWLKLSML